VAAVLFGKFLGWADVLAVDVGVWRAVRTAAAPAGAANTHAPLVVRTTIPGLTASVMRKPACTLLSLWFVVRCLIDVENSST